MSPSFNRADILQPRTLPKHVDVYGAHNKHVVPVQLRRPETVNKSKPNIASLGVVRPVDPPQN